MTQTKTTAAPSARRFLIADDKWFLRNLIDSMLVRSHAADIKHARDGDEAIRILAEARGQIDCVLCDWNMEPVNGLDLLRSVRAGNVAGTPRDLRFIMLTGHADECVVKAAITLDVNGYVVKPVSMEKLLRAIDAAFTNPVVLKPAESYRAKSPLDPPGMRTIKGKQIPPWVLLSAMRDNSKEALSTGLEQIRREGDGRQENTPKLEQLSIKNEEYAPLDKIPSGKILAEDIYAEGGRLLLAKGTVLNERCLWRLRELATASSQPVYLRVGDSGD